jgi:hypothetical protein
VYSGLLFVALGVVAAFVELNLQARDSAVEAVFKAMTEFSKAKVEKRMDAASDNASNQMDVGFTILSKGYFDEAKKCCMFLIFFEWSSIGHFYWCGPNCQSFLRLGKQE